MIQGQALAVDGTIVPTIDAPEYGYTRETTEELYCPDIFYREKDEYGNSVTKIGRPLPIEYLLTDVRRKKLIKKLIKIQMGVNFALEFTYSVSNKVRSFSSTDKSIESIGAYLRNFSDDDLFQGTGIQHLVVFEISAN